MSTPQLETPMALGPDAAGLLMTPEEFDAVTDYDDQYGYELIRGVLVVTPIPLEAESDPNEELGHWLRSYRDDHPNGSTLDKTLPERYVRTAQSRRKADRLIWVGLGRLPDSRADVPTIVVEFVSVSRRDRRRDYEEKRREYLEIGVAEYWIIDRFRRSMTIFRDPTNGLAEQVVAEADVYRTDLLPGFELPLARLLDVADDWRERDD